MLWNEVISRCLRWRNGGGSEFQRTVIFLIFMSILNLISSTCSSVEDTEIKCLLEHASTINEI